MRGFGPAEIQCRRQVFFDDIAGCHVTAFSDPLSGQLSAMPVPAPVTTAIFPLKSFISLLSVL
jgi:hypothetical protein